MNREDKEQEFGAMFGQYASATDEQNIKEHWDIAIDEAVFERFLEQGSPYQQLPTRVVNSGDPIRVDVKAHPKGKQAHSYRWVELINVNGDKGWLYGLSDYIAFEHGNYWVLVSTRRLAMIVEANLKGPVTSEDWETDPQAYHVHTRSKRMDMITQVPLMDLCWIGRILQKPKIDDNKAA